MGAVRPAALACLICSSCYPDAGSPPTYDAGATGDGARDLRVFFPPEDLAEEYDLLDTRGPDPCGDWPPRPDCYSVSFDAPFSLQRDPQPDPARRDQGLGHTPEGFLRLAGMEVNGTYRALVPGCIDNTGESFDTMWYRVNWEGDVVPGTSIKVRAQSGVWKQIDDAGWQSAAWTFPAPVSPLDLQKELKPNVTPRDPFVVAHNGMLRVELELSSQVPGRSPVLRYFDVAFKCCCGD